MPTQTLDRAAIIDKINRLTPAQRAQLMKALVPRVNDQYMPHTPHPPQQLFLTLQQQEILFGGAAGGGKSDAILMAALQYVDVPGYNALILRRTYSDLVLPGAIMDRANDWLKNTDAKKRDSGKVWVFPSGARLTFGYLQNAGDRDRYASAEFQFVGFDELTHFLEDDYTFLFSRMRRPTFKCVICRKGIKMRPDKTDWMHVSRRPRIKATNKPCPRAVPDHAMMQQYGPGKDGMRLWNVPLRMRGASNPGARGHEWVKRRFVDPATRLPTAMFVPSRLKDNPSIDEDEYNKSLEHLLPIDRERLKNGDWDVALEGNMFRREWWGSAELRDIPPHASWARFWDLAATEGGGDYTAGCLMAWADGIGYVVDIYRDQMSPHKTELAVRRCAERDAALIGDRHKVRVYIEQEPGSSGKSLMDHYRRNVLPDFYCKAVSSSTSKELRATPLSNAVESGRVKLIPGQWNGPLMDEAALFPEKAAHDDQVDAVAGVFNALARSTGSRIIV